MIEGANAGRGPKKLCQLIEAIRHGPRKGQLLRLSHPLKHFGSDAVRNARCEVEANIQGDTLMLPQLYRHAWMDGEIDAFREQVRRYVARIPPRLDEWRRQAIRARSGVRSAR